MLKLTKQYCWPKNILIFHIIESNIKPLHSLCIACERDSRPATYKLGRLKKGYIFVCLLGISYRTHMWRIPNTSKDWSAKQFPNSEHGFCAIYRFLVLKNNSKSNVRLSRLSIAPKCQISTKVKIESLSVLTPLTSKLVSLSIKILWISSGLDLRNFTLCIFYRKSRMKSLILFLFIHLETNKNRSGNSSGFSGFKLLLCQ